MRGRFQKSEHDPTPSRAREFGAERIVLDGEVNKVIELRRADAQSLKETVIFGQEGSDFIRLVKDLFDAVHKVPNVTEERVRTGALFCNPCDLRLRVAALL